MVVRGSTRIPGGYRIVLAGLTEDGARRRAQEYERPHMAMAMRELIELRMAAIARGGRMKP